MSLLRRIRPQLQDYDRDDEHMSDASSVQSIGEDKGAAEDDDGDSEDSEDSEEGFEAEVANAQETLSTIPFGVLAKALSKDRINPSLSSKEDRIAAVKSRLAEINSSSASWKDAPKDPNKKWKTREELKRASKNAPQEVSSKRAVTRKRTVVDPLVSAAQKARDPRFDAAVTGTFDERRFRKNYAFLDGYRGDEIKSMKEEMAKSKDERRQEELKKTVFSMESKMLAQKNKDRAEELASERKKKENDLVKQGKKPFYLKKAEQKKALLVDKYSKFNEKQLDKVMEKKRKRKSQKEKKNMPWSRRVE